MASGFTAGLVGNSKNIFNAIKQSLSQGLSNAISYGVNLGLNEAGLPPIASGFLSQFLGSVIGGQLGGGSSGGPGGPNKILNDEIGKNWLEKIADNVIKFGSGLVRAVGDVISLGVDIIQRGYEAVKNTFTSLFSRQTQEILYQASQSGGVGVGAGWVLSGKDEYFDASDNLIRVRETFTNTAGDQMVMVTDLQDDRYGIQYNMADGRVRQEVYEGVGRGVGGGFSWGSIAFAEELGDGVRAGQGFDIHGLGSISAEKDGQQIFSIASESDFVPVKFNQDGGILNGEFKINLNFNNSLFSAAELVLNFKNGVGAASLTNPVLDMASSDITLNNAANLAQQVGAAIDAALDWLLVHSNYKTEEEKYAELIQSINDKQVRYEGCPEILGNWKCSGPVPNPDDPGYVQNKVEVNSIFDPQNLNVWNAVSNGFPLQMLNFYEFGLSLHASLFGNAEFQNSEEKALGEVWDASGQIRYAAGSIGAQRIIKARSAIFDVLDALKETNDAGHGSYRIFFEKKAGEGYRWFVVGGIPYNVPHGTDLRMFDGFILSEAAARQILGLHDE